MVAIQTLSTRVKVLGAAAVAAAVTIGLTAGSAISQNRTTINVDGSSTVFPISEAMAEEFGTANPNVDITVGVSGTGGGFKKFCAGDTDISNASRPIKQSEIDLCKAAGIEYQEVKVAIDALTVVVNLENTWVNNMTSEELKKLWEPAAERTVTRWNQVNSSWPNRPIRLYGPGTDSGTFDYFTAEINGEEGASRTDYTASEDDNVLVLGVSRDENALGYFGLAYYLENQSRLKAVDIDGVTPSIGTIDDYPLSRPIFVYVNKESLRRPEVRAFVEFHLEKPELISEVGYIPLSESDYAAARAAL